MDLDKQIEGYRQDILTSTQEILRIPSVKGSRAPGAPFGEGITQALHYALSLSEKLGFETKNFDGYIGHAEYGEGEEILGILVHLDVVPAGVGWTYPPFGGEIRGGRIYGRGAIDNKGPAMAALYALKAVRDLGQPLSKKVRIIFGCDEESGWEDIEYYRTREKMPDLGFAPDADFPVINTEKGIVHISLSRSFNRQGRSRIGIREVKGGTRANVVPEEAVCVVDGQDADRVEALLEDYLKENSGDIRLEREEKGNAILRSLGVSAHGSTPEKGRNAIGQLLLFLSSLDLGEGEMADTIRFLAWNIGMDHSGQGLQVAFEDEISGRLTLNLGTISLTEKGMDAVLDIRYPVRYREEEIFNPILHVCRSAGIEARVVSGQSPLHVDQDDPLVRRLKKVYGEVTGQEAYTIAIGGGTYARALDKAVAFGPLFPGKEEMAHQRDEYIDIEDLLLSARIYGHAIYELAK